MEVSSGTTTAIHTPRATCLMSLQSIFRSRRGLSKLIVRIALLAAFVVPAIVRAQDAVRPSLAGEAASEARRQDIERIPYNLLAGPMRFRLGASIGIEY